MQEQSLLNAEKQGILNSERLTTVGDDYFGKPAEFAMRSCAIYECNSCEKPFFGGLTDCEQEMA